MHVSKENSTFSLYWLNKLNGKQGRRDCPVTCYDIPLIWSPPRLFIYLLYLLDGKETQTHMPRTYTSHTQNALSKRQSKKCQFTNITPTYSSDRSLQIFNHLVFFSKHTQTMLLIFSSKLALFVANKNKPCGKM